MIEGIVPKPVVPTDSGLMSTGRLAAPEFTGPHREIQRTHTAQTEPTAKLRNLSRRFAPAVSWVKNFLDPHKLALAGLGAATMPWHLITQFGGMFKLTGRGPLTYLTSLGLWGHDLSGKKVLDVGCGASLFALCANIAYADTGALVASMDLIIPPLSPLGVRGDCMQAKFNDGTFDLIVSNWLFPHLQSFSEATKFIDEMLRMTKPGGEIRIGLAPHFAPHPKSFWLTYLKEHPAVADVDFSPGLPFPGLPSYFSARLKPNAVTDTDLSEYALKQEAEGLPNVPWRRQFMNASLKADFQRLAASPSEADQFKAIVIARRISFNSGDEQDKAEPNQALVALACREGTGLDITLAVLKHFLLSRIQQDYGQIMQALPETTRVELYNRMAADETCSRIIAENPKDFFVCVPDADSENNISEGVGKLKKMIKWERELRDFLFEERMNNIGGRHI